MRRQHQMSVCYGWGRHQVEVRGRVCTGKILEWLPGETAAVVRWDGMCDDCIVESRSTVVISQ